MTGTNFGALRKDALTVLTGEFGVVIKDVTSVRNSKNNPMLKVKAVVESGVYAGRMLNTNMNFSPDSPTAQKILFSQFDTLGLGEQFFDGLTKAGLDDDNSWGVIARELVGRRATVIVGTREWQGQQREEINAWLPPIGQPNRAAVFNPGLAGMGAASVGAAGAVPVGGASAASSVPSAASLPSTAVAATLSQATTAKEVSQPATTGLASSAVEEPPALPTDDLPF